MKVAKIMKNKEITVLDQEIHINKDDYFSLTDIAKYKNPEDPRFVIQNWMRRIDTIQYMGLWEQLNNPNFNRVEFGQIKKTQDITILQRHLLNGLLKHVP